MKFFQKRTSIKASPGKSAQPAFSEPNEAEVAWMRSHLQIIAASGVDLDDARQVGEFYDQVLRSWLSVSEESRTDPNDAVNLLGTAFGECLVRQSPLRWVVASDVHGVELALHDDRSDFLVYPANVVAKRLANRQPGDFIPAMAEVVKGHRGAWRQRLEGLRRVIARIDLAR